MLRKYILVCHYGSLFKNNLLPPHKSGPLKTQAPPPAPHPTPVFLVRNNFSIPSKRAVSKKFTLSWQFRGGGGGGVVVLDQK